MKRLTDENHDGTPGFPGFPAAFREQRQSLTDGLDDKLPVFARNPDQALHPVKPLRLEGQVSEQLLVKYLVVEGAVQGKGVRNHPFGMLMWVGSVRLHNGELCREICLCGGLVLATVKAFQPARVFGEVNERESPLLPVVDCCYRVGLLQPSGQAVYLLLFHEVYLVDQKNVTEGNLADGLFCITDLL